MSHGKFAGTLISAKLAAAGKQVTISEHDGELKPAFQAVTAKLKAGKSIAGINISQTLQMPVTGKSTNPVALGEALYPNDTSKREAFTARGNAGKYTAADRAAVKSYFLQKYDTTLPAYQAMLNEAAKRNVPVTVAAGNEANQLNVLTLFEPAIAVGSLGKNKAISGSSSKVTQTDAYSTGEINHTKVAGGIDVTGDGKADFSTAQLSNGKSKLSQVLGKSYSSTKASPGDYQAVATYFANLDNLPVNGGKTAVPNVAGKVFDLQKLTSLMNSEAAKTGQGITSQTKPLAKTSKTSTAPAANTSPLPPIRTWESTLRP